ncbi:MAG: hypothetical protein QW751_00300 [Candidatus Aenigmatarchaeota archaeon]|nr:hypothetical protein [Candidatus Aenigmarchaeota archaeon]
MAEFICFVKRENARKAEDMLRADFDVAAKQSITVRDASALGIKEAGDGSFFYITGSDEGVKKCQELIKDFVVATEKQLLDKAKTKIIEEQEAAAAGFGGIFG